MKTDSSLPEETKITQLPDLIILIGHLRKEPIVVKIKTNNYEYIQRLLYSRPGNWKKIINEIKKMRVENRIAAIYINFTQGLFNYFLHPEYSNYFVELFHSIDGLAVRIIHQYNLFQIPITNYHFTDPYDSHYFHLPGFFVPKLIEGENGIIGFSINPQLSGYKLSTLRFNKQMRRLEFNQNQTYSHGEENEFDDLVVIDLLNNDFPEIKKILVKSYGNIFDFKEFKNNIYSLKDTIPFGNFKRKYTRFFKEQLAKLSQRIQKIGYYTSRYYSWENQEIKDKLLSIPGIKELDISSISIDQISCHYVHKNYPELFDLNMSKKNRVWKRDPLYFQPLLSNEMKIQLEEFIAGLKKIDIKYLPYEKEEEIGKIVANDIDDLKSGTILRIYISNKHFQSLQIDSFIQLFENYLYEVEKQDILITREKTKSGIVYLFQDINGIIQLENLDRSISRFEEFSNLCLRNIESARKTLINFGIDQKDVGVLVKKYTVKFKRLIIDVKHEFEEKALRIQHALENEGIEASGVSYKEAFNSIETPILNNFYVNPKATQIINLSESQIEVNESAVINKIIDQSIFNEIQLTENDKELFSLIEQYSQGLKRLELMSSVNELKENEISEKDKEKNKQNLIKFLTEIGKFIGSTLVKELIKYLLSL